MKKFIGKKVTKKVKFMDDEVEVKLLTVNEVKQFEELSKEFNKKDEEDRDDMTLLRAIVRLAVVGAEDLSDEDFGELPIAELSTLAENIMGVIAPAPEGN